MSDLTIILTINPTQYSQLYIDIAANNFINKLNN